MAVIIWRQRWRRLIECCSIIHGQSLVWPFFHLSNQKEGDLQMVFAWKAQKVVKVCDKVGTKDKNEKQCMYISGKQGEGWEGLSVSNCHSVWITPSPHTFTATFHVKMPPQAATLRVAASLISPFRSTKSTKIPLEILMCVAELTNPLHQHPPPLTVVQLLNINSVWQQTVGFWGRRWIHAETGRERCFFFGFFFLRRQYI